MSIIPDDFDWNEARVQPSTTPEDERDRCPECGSLSISPRTGRGGGQSAHPVEWNYECGVCSNRFDEPARGGE